MNFIYYTLIKLSCQGSKVKKKQTFLIKKLYKLKNVCYNRIEKV